MWGEVQSQGPGVLSQGKGSCLVLTSNACALSAGRGGKRVFGYGNTEQLAAGKAAAGIFGNCSKIQPVVRLGTTSQPLKESESHRLEGYISSGEQQQQSAGKLCRAHLSCLSWSSIASSSSSARLSSKMQRLYLLCLSLLVLGLILDGKRGPLRLPFLWN